METALTASLLEGVPRPLILISAAERIVQANAQARAMFGDTITGRHFVTVLRQPSLIEAIERALLEQTQQTARHFSNDAGRETMFQVDCAAVAGGGVLLTFDDITHVREAEQIRRDFVANVSHELRTPLTALLGFIETLQGPAKNDPAAQERFLGIMSREAARMNRLVQDLLSLSRVETEERMRPTQQVDVYNTISMTLNALTPVAEAAGVKFEMRGARGPIMVQGDPDQLGQVFTNLIENGIKYGAKGGLVAVEFTLNERDPRLRGPGVAIRVSDQGEGFDPIHIPRLTERFYRVDSHRSREMGGTGLGLAIVKHIVSRHRGRIRIESAVGEGASFIVILPQHSEG
ncbi:MAG: ATP-binding protein [Pseudomonadota bacterium]